MNETLTKRDAHTLLQEALAQPLGLLIWSSDPVALAQVLYRARREDPVLHPIKILNVPEGTALVHEPQESWSNEPEVN